MSVNTPTASDFQAALNDILKIAAERGNSSVSVRAGDLHRSIGGYPQPNHRMPVCCDVMRQTMNTGDVIMYEPPKGKGASLEIRYRLPR